jgi:hypothetical protein
VLAVTALRELDRAESQRKAKKNVLKAIEAVAGVLGNTRAVCRKSYIHPAVVDSYVDGWMLQVLSRRATAALKKIAAKLRPDEVAVLAVLQYRIGKDGRQAQGRVTLRLASLAHGKLVRLAALDHGTPLRVGASSEYASIRGGSRRRSARAHLHSRHRARLPARRLHVGFRVAKWRLRPI